MGEYEMNLEYAIDCWIARRNGTGKVPGKFDKADRFHPDEAELRDCCQRITPPNADNPWSLLEHCKTIRHVARVYHVNEADLRRAIPARMKQAIPTAAPEG